MKCDFCEKKTERFFERKERALGKKGLEILVEVACRDLKNRRHRMGILCPKCLNAALDLIRMDDEPTNTELADRAEALTPFNDEDQEILDLIAKRLRESEGI